jgi:hypothetical protein
MYSYKTQVGDWFHVFLFWISKLKIIGEVMVPLSQTVEEIVKNPWVKNLRSVLATCGRCMGEGMAYQY